MSKKPDTRAMIEGALLAALTILLAISSIYAPFMSFMYIILPVPIAVVGYRHGIRTSILTMIVSLAIIAMLYDPMSLFMTISLGMIGVAIGYTQREKMPAVNGLLIIFFIGLFSTLISLWLISVLTGVNVVNQNINMLTRSMQYSISLYKKMGVSGQIMNNFEEMVKSTLSILKIAIPFIIISYVAILVYINNVITVKILQRLGHNDLVLLPPFSMWIVPRSVALLFVVVLIINTFIRFEGTRINVDQILTNAILIAMMAFLIDGLSLIVYYMKQKNIGKVFQVIVFIIVLFNGVIGYITALIGLLDSGFDFRRIRSTARR